MKKFQSYPLIRPIEIRGALFLAWMLLRIYVRCAYYSIAEEIVAIVFVSCFCLFGLFVWQDLSGSLDFSESHILIEGVFRTLAQDFAVLVLAGFLLASAIYSTLVRTLIHLIGSRPSYIFSVFKLSFAQSSVFVRCVVWGNAVILLSLLFLILDKGSQQSLLLALAALNFWLLVQCLCFGFWLSYFLDHLWWHRLSGMDYGRFLKISLCVSLFLAISNVLFSGMFYAIFYYLPGLDAREEGLTTLYVRFPLAVALAVVSFPAVSLLAEPRRGFSTGLYAWMYVVLLASLCLYSMWFVPLILVAIFYGAVYQAQYFARV